MAAGASDATVPCLKPIRGERNKAGRIVPRPAADLLFDFGYDPPITVPCGQCRWCRLERSRQWAVRMMHETKTSQAACFVTLTYDDKHLPDDENLSLAAWRLFAKRFRKRIGPFRYYHCGEYGENTGRPHYHACIWGHDFAHDRKLYTQTKFGPLWTSPTLEATWGLGFATLGQITFRSAAYVARYCMKRPTKGTAVPKGHVDLETGEIGREPEYATMSRRPGIGTKWLERFQSDVYPSDEVIVDGRSTRPPKFYDGQLELTDPTLFAQLKAKRVAKAQSKREHQTSSRLLAAEKNLNARLKLKKRGF